MFAVDTHFIWSLTTTNYKLWTALSVKLRLATKNYRIPTKNAANKLSYNREEKALHGHNLQREHDTGGTPAKCKIKIGNEILSQTDKKCRQ